MFIQKLIFIIFVLSVEGSIVYTTTGPVRGKHNHDHNVSYYSYEGIPYAECPGGQLRFKAPVPKKPWSRIFNATQPGPVCPQSEGSYKKSQMSEDCLVTNVYVPANETGQLLPVLAFVHGGAYKDGSGNIDVQYGPQFYLKRGVVFVYFNYRFGALGFLSLGNKDAPGNAGLKDIILALKWVKANIGRFGGDNKKITIGGSSSGSSAAHYLTLTDKTTGLFQQALLVSGSAVSFRFIQKEPIKNALELADKLNLLTEDYDQFVTNLATVDPLQIVHAQGNISESDKNEMRQFNPFVPSVEPESPEAIITMSPLDIIKSGPPQKVPILVGFNSLEGIYRWGSTIKNNKTFIDNLPRLFVDCIPPDVNYPKTSKSYQNLVTSISELYFGDQNLSNFTLHNFLKLHSDTQYMFNYDYWIREYIKQRSSNALYYYEFEFEGDLNWSKLMFNVTGVSGVGHSDDLGYQYVTKITDHLLNNIDKRSQRMMDVMMTLFTNFIKYGNPTPDGYEGTKWPQYSPKGKYLHLTDYPWVGDHGPNARRFDFWYNVYQRYDQYIKEGGRSNDDNNPFR